MRLMSVQGIVSADDSAADYAAVSAAVSAAATATCYLPHTAETHPSVLLLLPSPLSSTPSVMRSAE